MNPDGERPARRSRGVHRRAVHRELGTDSHCVTRPSSCTAGLSGTCSGSARSVSRVMAATTLPSVPGARLARATAPGNRSGDHLAARPSQACSCRAPMASRPVTRSIQVSRPRHRGRGRFGGIHRPPNAAAGQSGPHATQSRRCGHAQQSAAFRRFGRATQSQVGKAQQFKGFGSGLIAVLVHGCVVREPAEPRTMGGLAAQVVVCFDQSFELGPRWRSAAATASGPGRAASGPTRLTGLRQTPPARSGAGRGGARWRWPQKGCRSYWRPASRTGRHRPTITRRSRRAQL